MKKQEIKKNEEGITLVALVVTIVVLIILASIGIGTLTGDSGTISQTQSAKNQAEIAEEKEVLGIAATFAMDRDKYGNLTESNFREELNAYIGEGKYSLDVIDEKIFKVTFTESKREYYIDKDGNIVEDKIILSNNKITLKVGATKELKVTIIPPQEGSSITWSSNNESVATVDSAGNVTAIGEGTATITVTVRQKEETEKTATCEVKVISDKVGVTGVTLNPNNIILKKESTQTLVATVAPSDATNKNVSFSSSNTAVVTVDSTGKVTAVDEGSATITVTTEDGNKTATCKVEVIPSLEEGEITYKIINWSDGKATVEITTVAEGYILQYGVDTQNYSSATGKSVTLTGINHGQTIYVRNYYKAGETEYKDHEQSISVIDGNDPSAEIVLATNIVTTNTQVTATVTHTDNESGINISKCRWVYTTSPDLLGTEDESQYTNIFSSNGQAVGLKSTDGSVTVASQKYSTETTVTTLEGTMNVPGGTTISGIVGEYNGIEKEGETYYLHVLTVDKGGNKVETVSDAIIDNNEGIVIYVIPSDITITNWYADENSNGIIDVQETYDQFVWVPVPNPVAIDKNSSGTIDATDIDLMIAEEQYPMAIEISGTDSNGLQNYRGVLYDFTLTDGKVVASDLSWSSDSTSYREPAYLNNMDDGDAGIDNTVGITESSLQEEFNTMVNRVKNNKGFWTGRYETSNMAGTSLVDFESDSTNRVTVIKGTTTGIYCLKWYRMYAQQKNYSKLALGSTTTTTSSMIWGSQWDQIMIWMKDVDNTSQSSKYVVNAIGMGNFGSISGVDDGWSSTSAPAPTGYQESYKVKNIYDLAGNVEDWTLEADYNLPPSRVVRRRRLLPYD